jgi:undecaprenyl-diphosphatase
LGAVFIYFWQDILRLIAAAWASLKRRSLADPYARIAWAIALGTVPGVILGVLFDETFERLFGMPRAAAGFLLGTAALLVLSEYVGRREREMESITWGDAVLIGLGQSLAIAPGLSRSGTTISTGLLLGFRREDAARFSFLLSIPIILGSGLYQFLKVMRGDAAPVPVAILLVGFLAAGVTGYLAIAALLALVRRRSLWPFAIYCALLGILVLTGVLA